MTSTIEVMPDSMLTMDQKVEKWCAQLITSLQFDYDSQYPKGRVKFYLRTGRKYHKIVEQNGGVHCFINKKSMTKSDLNVTLADKRMPMGSPIDRSKG